MEAVIFLLALWIVGAIIFFTDTKNEINRCAGIYTFVVGFIALDDVIEVIMLLWVKGNGSDNLIISDLLFSLNVFCDAFSLLSEPYLYLIFCIVYAGIWVDFRKIQYCIFLIPTILMIIFFPMSDFATLEYTSSKLAFAIWISFYYIAGNIILIYSYIKEKRVKLKSERVITCLILVPIQSYSIFWYWYYFANSAISNNDKYDADINLTWLIIIWCIVFLVFAAKFGAMGVKVKFEKNRLTSSIRGITSGVSILNHTIKNEILKISIHNENLKYNLNIDDARISQSIEAIEKSTSHMMNMVERIQEQLQEFALIETQNNLADIVEQSLDMIKPYIESRSIIIKRNYYCDVDVFCDNTHIKEVLSNILKNAIEAMEIKGELEIQIYSVRKKIILAVKDNGTGIPKEFLRHVAEPFFTTKRNSQNFGLGLSYCYSVMEMHGGTLEIESEENKGTTVFLNFPSRKVLKISNKLIMGKYLHNY